jgi:hypothetical protein
MRATTEDACQHTQRLLDVWRGGYARVWEFSPSLDTLTLRIVLDDRPGNLHVVCSPCVSLAGSIHWENCRLRASCQQEDDGETSFVLRDESARFQAVCRGLTAFKNVEPLL